MQHDSLLSTVDELKAENERLRMRLSEAEETIEAIQSGSVDAVVINTEIGKQVFTLQGADFSYRKLVETMNEGAVTLAADHTIMFCNARFAEIVNHPAEKITGNLIDKFIQDDDFDQFASFIKEVHFQRKGLELKLKTGDGSSVPVLLSVSPYSEDGGGIWLIFTDLTELKKAHDKLLYYNEHLEEIVVQRTEELNISKERYKSLFESLIEGFCIIDVLIDEDGKCYDYRFDLTNPAFEIQSGLHHVQGKLISEVLPENEDYWYEYYGEIALTGQSKRFDQDSASLGRWFNVVAFKIGGEDSRKVGILFNDITIRKKAQTALQESEYRYRMLYESLRDAFVRVDMNGNIRGYNEIFSEMLGYSAEELQKLTYVDLTPEKWHAFENKIVREQITTRGYSDVYEKEYIRKDGSIIPIELRTILSKDDKGDPEGMWALIRDISQRKTAEAEREHLTNKIHEERDRLSALVNSITDEIWFANAAKEFMLMNPAALKEFSAGIGEERDISKIAGSLEVYRPDGTARPVEEAPPLRALRGETVKDQEEIIRTPAAKQLRYRQVSAAPVRDKEGNIIGSVCVVRDITEQKKAEESLRESEEKYRNLFDNMTEEVHFWELIRDEQGEIKTWKLVDANPSTLATWGRKSIEEIRGKTTDEIFGPGATGHYMPIVQKIMKEGSPYSYEDYFEHLDKYFRFTSVPVGDYFITTGADITDIRKATEALRESEEKYRMLIETAGEGIVVSKTNGEFTFTNRQFQQMLGYTAAELIGKTGFDIVAEDYKALVTPNREILKKGNILYGEFKFKRKDGSEIITSYSASPLFDKDGNHIANFAMHTDITERKKTEAALLQSRSDLDRAQEVGSIGSWRLDTLKNILTWSDENHRIFGLPKEPPLSYESFLNTIHPEDIEYVDTNWNAALKGEPYDIEHRIIVDGKTKWVREKAYLEFDQAKNLLGGFGITQDITYRKITEEALRESEATLSGILNAATESIWLFSKDGIALLGNQTAFSRFKLPPEKIIGKSAYDILPKDLADSRISRLHETAETRKPIRFEDERDGIWFEHTFYPVIGSKKHVDRIAIFSRDITERKQAEAALKKYQEELEATVKERTRDLQNANELLHIEIAERKQKEQALIDSKKHLRELAHRMDTIAEEERIRIAREIHDEIGHLLTALKYDAERLATTPGLSAELLNQDIEAMISMIDAVIDTVRKISTELRPGILDHLGLIPAIDWQIKQFSKRTKINCDYTPVEINRIFDKNETIIIFRIVQEILTNIIRHANASKVKITISEKNDRFQLRISDNGVGFEVKDDLFTGSLGLLGMRERALTIGAEIKIKSKIGKGTEINFILGK